MTSDPAEPTPSSNLPPPDSSMGTPPERRTDQPESGLKFTRAAALWSALILGFVILIVLLVFIMQNTDSTSINFFAWEASLPVGVAVLLAAVCGGLLTVAVGTARIVQLRRAAKKSYKALGSR